MEFVGLAFEAYCSEHGCVAGFGPDGYGAGPPDIRPQEAKREARRAAADHYQEAH